MKEPLYKCRITYSITDPVLKTRTTQSAVYHMEIDDAVEDLKQIWGDDFTFINAEYIL